MEWVNILAGIITFLVFAIGLPLALRKRKKSGPQNVEQLLHHLQEIGVKASLAEKSVDEEKVGASRSFMRRSEDVIKIEGRNIDYINVSSVSSQYGVNYFLDYLVRSSSQSGQKRQKKTRMVRKKSPAIWGRVVDIEWKGDVYLSQQLNLDYRLKDIVLQTEPKELKSNIVIFPEPKHEYARVRTAYLLPSPDLFEAIDIIAKYIKSG
ncbi:hypothetical protein ES705_31804 [subsurface metagenome]